MRELEVTLSGWLVGGWVAKSDNMAISVQTNLMGTGTGNELGNISESFICGVKDDSDYNIIILTM